MKKKDIQIAELRLALTRASAVLDSIAAQIRAMDMPQAIEFAGIHSMAYCAERAARRAVEAARR